MLSQAMKIQEISPAALITDTKPGQALSFTDVDDATVSTTHFTRDGNAIHADGVSVSTSDKVFAVAELISKLVFFSLVLCKPVT